MYVSAVLEGAAWMEWLLWLMRPSCIRQLAEAEAAAGACGPAERFVGRTV